ncbi:MAG: thioredoxin domain-containing protein [Candidatus Uhrbacteria bacterium]
METQSSNSKSFFDALSTKQAFWLGVVAAVLVLGTLGCVVLGSYIWKGGEGKTDNSVAGGSQAQVANTATGAAAPAANTNVEELYKKIATEVGLDASAFDSCRSSDRTLANIQADQASASAAGVRGTPASFLIGKDGKAKQIQGGAVAYSSMKALIDQTLGVTVSGTPAALVDVTGTLAPVAANDFVLGDTNSSITIITYSDFQCPYCSRFDATMQQVMKEYSSKVKWVYRNFPLSFHDQAQNAAEAAECAGEQGKFWEYALKLFENQSSL